MARSVNKLNRNNNKPTLLLRGVIEKNNHITMLKRTFPLLIVAIALSQATLPAQQNDTIPEGLPAELNVNYTAPPKKYIIADIDITGVEGSMYEDQKFV